MRALLWLLLTLFLSSVYGAESLRCGLVCNTEVQFSGLSWRQGIGMGLSFPLELYQPEPAISWDQQRELLQLPVLRARSSDELQWRLRSTRPELKWKGEWGSGAVRLNGHRLRLRLQNVEQTQQLQFTVEPEEMQLEFRLRY